MSELPTRLVDFTSYQKALLEDDARFIICMWTRQSGKSFGVAWKVALEALARRELWVILSRGERQSREAMTKVTQAVRALGHAVEEIEGTFQGDAGAEYKQLEVRLPNGSRVVGLPANPDTARGFSGNVVLDEFAFHADSRAIWTSLFPTITRGYRIIVLSTPNGMQNKFYELWAHGGEQWSRHRVDIYTAVAGGLKVEVEQLRAGINDPDAWAQEYECQFIDAATAFLTWEAIDACEDSLATMTRGPLTDGGLYLGFDVARRRDLSVVWICQAVGDVLWTREVLRMERTPFRAQREALFERLVLPGMRRACIDATGLGMQIAEEAQERFGTLVEGVMFTPAVKEDLAIHLRTRVEDRRIRLPRDAWIRQDLHAVRKVTTSAGNVRYDADRSESGGNHADHFWSLALSVHAAATGFHGPVDYTPVAPRRFSSQKGAW